MQQATNPHIKMDAFQELIGNRALQYMSCSSQDACKHVFIANLSHKEFHEQRFVWIMKQFGKIDRICVMYASKSNKNKNVQNFLPVRNDIRGYAFVQYENKYMAAMAIATLQGMNIPGVSKRIYLKFNTVTSHTST